jgi:protein-disulfide isomerase
MRQIFLERIILMMRILKFPILASMVFVLNAADDSNGVARMNSPVVMEIDGTKITLADFEHDRPSALFQARNTFYTAERKAIDDYADDLLLKRQAKKENLTVDKLLEKHVSSTIAADPSEEALRVFYEGVDTAEPFEAVRGQIVSHIREKRISVAKKAYLQTLRDQGGVSIVLDSPRSTVSLVDTPVRGPMNAPVTLIEYADYECPYCQQMQGDLDKLETEFKGKLAFAYKDTPLPMHAHARKAAEAAQCAGVQNKYWEFHDELLKTKQLDLTQLKADAQKLGLDVKAFDTCLDGGQRASVIEANLDDAKKLGISGTPSFFLNGRFISGVLKYEQMRVMVEEELKKVSTKEQRASRE